MKSKIVSVDYRCDTLSCGLNGRYGTNSNKLYTSISTMHLFSDLQIIAMSEVSDVAKLKHGDLDKSVSCEKLYLGSK